MRIWKQGGFLPRIYPHTRGDQTRQEQVKGDQGRETTNRYQNDQVHHGHVQLLPDTH
jgi:hypothetical protein